MHHPLRDDMANIVSTDIRVRNIVVIAEGKIQLGHCFQVVFKSSDETGAFT